MQAYTGYIMQQLSWLEKEGNISGMWVSVVILFVLKTLHVVVVVRLEHSHSFIDSSDNHSTASGPASCRCRRPPGNAVSGHSSTMCLVGWWLSH